MKTNTYILLLFSFLLSSCDPHWFNIEIDGNGFQKSFAFECGEIDVSGSTIGEQIPILLNFKLNNPIVLNPEKFEIKYKGEEIPYSRIYLNEVLLKETKSINNNSKVRIVIDLKVQSGDTIKINVNDFILCKEQPLGIGDINLILVRRK